MKIAIYGRPFSESILGYIHKFFNVLSEHKCSVHVHKTFYAFLKDQLNFHPPVDGVFNEYKGLDKSFDFMFSVGGDGTFLESANLVRDHDIPMLGVNIGRLGFLSTVSKSDVEHAVQRLIDGDYDLDERSLLELNTDNDLFGANNKALNEITIIGRGVSPMITVKAYIDGEYLNSYWADGLIIATPTGSTAYSLSVGGPIVMPGTQNFIISPIAPHNLTVRPLIIPDNKEITLKVEGRANNFVARLDFRPISFDKGLELRIRKADYNVQTVKFKGESFFSVIRNKLMWGLDKRN